MQQLLLIDHHTHDRRAFLRMVQHENLGYEVVTAASIADAIERLHEQFFDIILCDFSFPDGSALDLLTHYSQVVPFIIVTGMGDENTAVNVLKAGAYDYLVKDKEGHYLQHLPMTIEQVVRHRHMEDEKADQRRFVNALRDTASALNSSLDLEDILTRIQRNMQKVIPFESSCMMQVDGDQLYMLHTYRQPEELQEKFRAWRGNISSNPFFRTVIDSRKPQTRSEIILRRDSQTSHLIQLRGSCLCAPIIMDDVVVCLLTLQRSPNSHFKTTTTERLSVFADQVATALENAHLHQQAIETALTEERHRLARDLHDSVTQSLFAASVISGTLLKQWQTDPASIESALNDLHSLTRDALSEMRGLLLDLRPTSGSIGNLSAQIEQLAVAAQQRAHLEINVVNHGSYQPPPEVKNALFRIAQEALNNIVKHARAKLVRVSLNRQPYSTELEISDDGVGFSLNEQRGQAQMGLTFMKERAEEVGIQLKIDSHKQHGTRIRAVWSSKG